MLKPNQTQSNGGIFVENFVVLLTKKQLKKKDQEIAKEEYQESDQENEEGHYSNVDDEKERKMPSYFKTFEVEIQSQMGELLKNDDPAMLGVKMLGTTKRLRKF